MDLADIVTEVTGALTGLVPAATIAVFVAAGAVISLTVRFGRSVMKWGR
jgi:hypothetical protein